jgi:DNA-binding transcriptional regulator YiaG
MESAYRGVHAEECHARMTTLTFAEELKAWRARHGFTQLAASEYLRVAYNTLENWEQGRQEPGTPGPIRLLMEMRDDEQREQRRRARAKG